MAINNLNVNDYYFHSIIAGCERSFSILKNILITGAIKSPKSLKIRGRVGCNKVDEICLSANTKINNPKIYTSCFDLYLSRLVTLIIDKEYSKKYKVIKPKVITTKEIFSSDEYINGNVTNLYDEYRTRNDIPLKYIKGVSIPYNNLIDDPICFLTFASEEALMEYYNYGLDFNIIRSFAIEKSTEEEKKARIKSLENYIACINKLFEAAQLDIPIYTYENDKNFILK